MRPQGWWQSPEREAQRPRSWWAICTNSRGRSRHSPSPPASGESGGRLPPRSARSTACWSPVAESASPSGDTSRPRRERGRWRRFEWPHHPRFRIRPQWLRWAVQALARRSCLKSGFVAVERFDVPFAWEFADPETYARTLASTGPAYEAMQNVGEEEFIRNAVELARTQMRDGHVLRAEIRVVGFVARKPERGEPGHEEKESP